MLHAAPPATGTTSHRCFAKGCSERPSSRGWTLRRSCSAPRRTTRRWPEAPGSITASTPVVVVEDRASGKRAFHFLMEGFGRDAHPRHARRGRVRAAALASRRAAPALDAALQALGGIDCDAIMVEALRRGDELHNRNAAATSMLAERLARGLARAGVAADVQERLLEFMRGNPQFFVAVSLAASRLMLEAGHGVEGSSLLTAVGANGRECGIKVSGLGDRWFTAPAEVPEGVFLEGFGPGGRGAGLRRLAARRVRRARRIRAAAAPALWPLLGADEARARRIYDDTVEIALGEHPRYRVPVLGDRGAPVGVDVLQGASRPASGP